MDIKDKRNTTYKVTDCKDCKAKIIVKLVKKKCDYRFDCFEEIHNHELEDIYHLKSISNMSYYGKELIIRAFTGKIGATKAYKLKSTLNGNYQHVIDKD